MYTYGIIEHSFPLNFFLREWYLGSAFYQVVKVVNVVDTFRFQEQSPFDKKQWVTYMKSYVELLTSELTREVVQISEAASQFVL